MPDRSRCSKSLRPAAIAAGLILLGFVPAGCKNEKPGTSPAPTPAPTVRATPSSTSTPSAAAPAPGTIREDVIAGKIAKAQSGLRSMHVAMEAYRVDFDVYPDRAELLITPIAYLSKHIADPFFDGSAVATPEPGRPLPDPGPEYLKMAWPEDYSAVLLYSVGPDGVDQRGEFEYDPARGPMSEGDIVRRVELKDYMRFEDPEMSKRVKEQKALLEGVGNAVEAWYTKHRTLPDNLGVLNDETPYLGKVAKDLFSKSQPVAYRLNADKSTAIVYSVGPDGDDDRGAKTVRGRFVFGEIPDGDITKEIALADLKERFGDMSEEAIAQDDPMMAALLELKKQDGRDNAFIYYVRASKRMPLPVEQNTSKLIGDVLENGWAESAEPLLPLIAAYQPMFDEVRKGAAVDYAHGVGWVQGPATPVPNFLAAQMSAKMLCVEGRYFVSQERYKDALDNYMTALTMGRDYSATSGTLISGLISVAIESFVLESLHDLIRSGNLEADSLAATLDRLKVIERTFGGSRAGFEGEYHVMRGGLMKMRNNPELVRQAFGAGGPQSFLERLQWANAATQVDRILREHKEFWDGEFAYIDTPYWERDRDAHQREIEEKMKNYHPMVRIAIPNFLEADVRFIVSKAKLRLTQLATALEIEEKLNGQYPSALSDLAPKYFEKMPVDPFSGEPFKYARSADGRDYKLYSVGPDKVDGGGDTQYSPSNGTVSGGDLYMD